MAHLIKLESGAHLNLDNVIVTDSNGPDDTWAITIGGGITKLSPKDLEKIDQIADEGEQSYEPLPHPLSPRFKQD